MLENNISYLQQNRFRLDIKRLADVSFYCQTITLPTISLSSVSQPTMMSNIPLPGSKLLFEPLSINFKVNEDLSNYLEVYKWLVGLGRPKDMNQSKQYIENLPSYLSINSVNGTSSGLVSDATITVLSSHNNVSRQIIFYDMFPTTLSMVDFTTTDQDVEYITASATFSYLRYEPVV